MEEPKTERLTNDDFRKLIASGVKSKTKPEFPATSKIKFTNYLISASSSAMPPPNSSGLKKKTEKHDARRKKKNFYARKLILIFFWILTTLFHL